MTPYELGESGLRDAIPHLAAFLNSAKPNEIRLAASALGKLETKYHEDCSALTPLLLKTLCTNGAQARQYVLKCLTRFDLPHAEQILHLIREVADHDEKEYNRELALLILKNITTRPQVKEARSSESKQEEPANHNLANVRHPLTLTGEQNRILALPLENPIQIKGVAGSGKTTVAIYRAKHLLASAEDFFRDTHVCIFSFTKSLIKYVRSILGTKDQAITVTHFHKWAYAFLKARGFWSSHSVASNTAIDSILSEGLAKLRQQHQNRAILGKPPEFYKEEFSWLKGRRIFTKQEYLEAKRTGRGTTDRVTAQDKELLWSLYCHYCSTIQERGSVDFDDFALLVLAFIEKESGFKPPFSHIVVDEAQDLTPAQLLCITELVNPETNSLTIIADAAQRIYKSGFAWSDVGINVRGGRTVELKRNYRNTRQIAEAALSLLAHDPQQGDFSEHILPERQGPKPKVLHLLNGQQASHLRGTLQTFDLTKQSAVVLHRIRSGVSQLTNYLNTAGFNPTNISAQYVHRINSVGLFTSTMSSVKGLEFDHVFLCDVNDNIIPYPPGFTDANDELHISTERRLVYTCMTRARHTLHLISTGTPSRYLVEIDPATVETR